MRPLVDDIQYIPRGIVHFAYPQTRFGLALRRVADAVITSVLFKPVAARLTRVADSRRPLPQIASATPAA